LDNLSFVTLSTGQEHQPEEEAEEQSKEEQGWGEFESG
jgi:hypothetical protein